MGAKNEPAGGHRGPLSSQLPTVGADARCCFALGLGAYEVVLGKVLAENDLHREHAALARGHL